MFHQHFNTILFFQDYINKLSDQEYENHRDSLIAEKLERPKKMLDRSYIFRSEILAQQYQFDRVNGDVKVLQEVTKNQLYNFYKVCYVLLY